MTNRFTIKGLDGFADGSIDFDTDTVKMALLDPATADVGVKVITGATNASPIVVTIASHGWSNGDLVSIVGVGGNTAANGTWTLANVTTNTFELVGSTGNGAYTSGGWAVNLTVADNWDDLDAAVIGTPQTLGSKTVSGGGILDCADPTFTSVAGGATVRFLAVYKDTGTPSTSRTIAILDTATNMPLPTNGGNVTVTIDNGANKLGKL